jgi:hypothetical protein
MITDFAGSWSTIACQVLRQSYPHAAAHRSLDSSDVDVTPGVLHPAFQGSFDWHSSVHMQWSLVQLLGLAPDSVDPDAVPLLNSRLTPEAIGAEVTYLQNRPTYERPYGWSWAAALAAATHTSTFSEARSWARALVPLHVLIADLTTNWLERQALPVRDGLGGNTAFALTLLLDSYQKLGRPDVVVLIRETAWAWYGKDTDYDTRFEPSGTDGVSPALSEAELMRRILPGREFRDWIAAFLPGLGQDRHLNLLELPPLDDSGDGELTHLSGLALARAWQLRSLAATWPADSAIALSLRAGAERQFAPILKFITDGNFMSTHWLVSFAILAELEGLDLRSRSEPNRQ